MSSARFLLCGAALFLAVQAVDAAERSTGVLIYDGTTAEVAISAESGKDLWLTLPDLKRATKFELKPEGVCHDQLCFPIPEDRKKEFITERSGVTRFNVSEFARLLRQPVAYDEKHSVWYFGPRPEVQNDYLRTLVAPNFTLPDLDGKMHSLSDFRGKKVLLITWGSW
jgi:hypothetical protein